MKATKWEVTHHYQPTKNTCGYTALAILLSHYEKALKPLEIVDAIPQPTDEKGEPTGSITAQLVDWCQSQEMSCHMYTSDVFIPDLSWQGKDSDFLIERLETVRANRDMPVLGKHWTGVYIDAYQSMLRNGAKLDVVPFIKTDLLYELLASGPVYANIGATANGGEGRKVVEDDMSETLDDINGNVSTHSIVIYGNDENGNFLVADPWDGLVEIEPEQMVLAIQAAQIESDNQIFVIEKAGNQDS